MFRPTKKRPNKKRILTSRDSDDEEDDEQQEVVVKKPPKKKKKKQRQVVATMSFHVEEDEDEVEDQKGRRHKKKSRKRKGGMGYGGAAAAADIMDVDGEAEAEQVEEPETATLYGKEALEALKSQQKYKKKTQQQQPAKQQQEKAETRSTTETAQNEHVAPPDKKTKQDSSSFLNESYIPLNADQEPPVILTGDEAMTFGEEEHGATTTLEPTAQFVLQEETQETTESRAWEQEVVRRAGISQQPKAASASTTTTSLAAMKRQVQKTMTNLQTQQNDLQSAYHRRVADLERTREELDSKKEDLKTSASALEYYQELRHELASWVGALRELFNKVQPLQQAVLELNADCNNSMVQEQWQDDMIHILQRANLLENVVGRQQVIEEEEENETHVDEFGRDVKSQKVLEREKRARQRQRIRQEWQNRQKENTTIMEEDSDAYCGTESQVEERRERHDALALALDVATQDLDQQYTSLSNLYTVFEKWHSKYPDEYKQCFASLSLADLASLLIRVDLCAAFDPLHWLDGQVVEKGNDSTATWSPQISWLQDLQKASAGADNGEDESPISKVLDKVLVPAVRDLLDKNAYNVVSARQSHSLARFCQELCDAASPNCKSISQLKFRVVEYLRQNLENMSIPIVKADAINAATLNSRDDEIKEAVTYATKGQVHRIKKLLVNILQYWVPVLGDLLMEPVLDFATSQFLFVLSSLQAQGMGEFGTVIFSQVWQTLKTHTQWMERSDVMLQAAPLRAAAVAYGQS